MLLTEQIDLLVRYFGAKRVRDAVAKIKVDGDEKPRIADRKGTTRSRGPMRVNGTGAIESIRQSNPEKYRLLDEFLLRLKSRRVLPESQDIRYFAQVVGLKEISGKSRDDLIPKLMQFLMEQPVEKLQSDLGDAVNISERQRQMGFSVLTDKLLGKRSH